MGADKKPRSRTEPDGTQKSLIRRGLAPPSGPRARRLGALAVGAMAGGAVALGAMAIGRLAIGSLAIGKSRIRRLEIDELVVKRLRVIDLQVDGEPATPTKAQRRRTDDPFGRP